MRIRILPWQKGIPGRRWLEAARTAAVLLEVSGRKEVDMASVNQVLVISPEKEHHVKITATMNRCGVLSICCAKFVEARILLDKERFEVVFCHEYLPDGDLREVILAAKPTPVVVLSRFAEWDHYLDALRAGAYDYIACPPDPAETERIVWSALGNTRAIANGAVH